jgi:hypothetical protein
MNNTDLYFNAFQKFIINGLELNLISEALKRYFNGRDARQLYGESYYEIVKVP